MVLTLTRCIDRLPIAYVAICSAITILTAAAVKWGVFTTNSRWLGFAYIIRVLAAAKFLIRANARSTDVSFSRITISANANARCADVSYSR
jgi:hypothetical protein